MRAKLTFWNVAAGLPKNRPNGPGIEFFMTGNCECLLLARRRHTAEFYVGTPLGKKGKTKRVEDVNDIVAGEALRLRHALRPTP